MKKLRYKESKQNEFKTEVAVIFAGNVILFCYVRQDSNGYYIAGGHENEFKTDTGDYKRFVTHEEAVNAIKAVDYRKIETRTCIPLTDVKF